MAKTIIRIANVAGRLGSQAHLVAPNIRKELRVATRQAEKLIRKDFDKTVRTWHKKPIFDVQTIETQEDMIVAGSTDNRIWNYVDQGTKPHTIVPVRAKMLAFRVGGKPKTTPLRFGSFRGKPGTKLVFAKKVRHPGIAARRFSEKIVKRQKPAFVKLIHQAILRSLSKAK